MDLFIQNFEGTQREVLSYIDKPSFYVHQEVNERDEIGFNIYSRPENQTGYELVNYENSVFWNGQEFVIKEVSENAIGEQLYKRVIALHIKYTMQDGYQYDQITGTFTFNQCLNHIFAPDSCGFTFRVLDPNNVLERQEFENFGDDNYLRLIYQILDRFDVVMISNNKHLTFMPAKDFGERTNNVIRYKYNTDDVQFDIDTYNLKTQIMGFGKRRETNDGSLGDYYFTPITYTSPEVNRWGLRIATPVRDERYTIAGNMRQRLIQELQDYPEIVGNVRLKMPFKASLGDYVRFVYEPLNVNLFIQIKGIKEYPMADYKAPEISLSNTKQTMTKLMVKLAERR